MDFKELVQSRRSCRKFTTEEVGSEDLSLLLRAALMSPTSKNKQAWKFVVVDDKLKIQKLADSKEHGSQFLREAPLCIVVLGNTSETDCWIEDGAIAAYSILLQAEDLGLGACWVQSRGRGLSDGTTSNDIIHGILDLPDSVDVLCVIGVGHKVNSQNLKDEDNLKWENVSIAE